MPYNLRVPTSKTFYFQVVEGEELVELNEVAKDKEFDLFFTFRQASASDDEQRTQALSRREWRPDSDGKMSLFDETNRQIVNRTEIYLTLTDTDCNFPDGKKLEFEVKGGVTRVKNRAQFEDYWKAMYSHWAEVISNCCLRVNPNWDPKRQNAA